MALPYELMDEILCRLPVKPLLSFRCVSKGWCSLIDSPAFVKKHLKTTIAGDSNGLIINGGGKFYLADFESLDDDVTAAVEVNDPLKTLFSGAEFVGAANGLVCLSKNDMNEILLLNPSTRKFIKIPSAPAEFPRTFNMIETCLCGFGHDHVTDDYKVVKIAECYIQFHGIIVIVYSLKTNSWKRIQNGPGNIRFTGNWGMFASGALHWLAIKNPADCSEIIVGFDIGLEEFKEVPFPAVNGTFVNFNSRSLVHVGGSLCILDFYPKSRMDVWLMNNYGAENRWYKAFSVEQLAALGSFRFLRPVSFSKSGKDVLLEVDSAKLVWYDLERKTFKNVRIHGIPIKFDAHLYTESLLQLTEDKKLLKPPQDKNDKKQQKKRDDFLSRGFKLRL